MFGFAANVFPILIHFIVINVVLFVNYRCISALYIYIYIDILVYIYFYILVCSAPLYFPKDVEHIVLFIFIYIDVCSGSHRDTQNDRL